MSPKIKHLVISGGTNAGFSFFGVLQKLIDEHFLKCDELESVYATSAGTLTALFILLKYDMETIETFLVQRPWGEAFRIDLSAILRAIQTGGLFDKSIANTAMGPLLLGKDLSLDITLEEFYQFNPVDFHLYATNYTTLELVDISYKTHPNWKLLDAVYASCCLPILFVPFCPNESEMYIDGAVITNYPLSNCLRDGRDPDEILGIYYFSDCENEIRNAHPLKGESLYKLFDYLLSFVMKLWVRIIATPSLEDSIRVSNQIKILCPDTSIPQLMVVFNSQEERKKMIAEGTEEATKFLSRSMKICDE